MMADAPQSEPTPQSQHLHFPTRQGAIEHQLYATIQRKQPPIPPFSNSKGFDTLHKRRSSGDMVTNSDPDMCPYATSVQFQRSFHVPNEGQMQNRCNTLGRMKNLEMTEYQKQKLLEEANTVRIKVKKVQCTYGIPYMNEP